MNLPALENFENKISIFLKTFPPQTNFIAAVSGGADSTALLAALCAVRHEAESRAVLRVSCVHIEHGLRPAEESLGDADFVRGFCGKNGIKCHVRHIPPGKIERFARRKGTGIEAAARFYRHRALAGYAAHLGGTSVILLAHTKDDLLETALIRVLRGAGPAGLAAMPAVSNKNGYTIARPLLNLCRADVERYLAEKKIIWREDSTNTDEKYLRNRIRHQLVPLLNDAFPSWKTGVASLGQTQSLALDFIAEEAKVRIIWERLLKKSHEGIKAKNSGLISFLPSCSSEFLFTDETVFYAQPQIIREEALYQAINTLLSFRTFELSLQSKSIKRSVIRRFCEGDMIAADLGSVKITRKNGKITVIKTRKEYFEKGCSRLIK